MLSESFGKNLETYLEYLRTPKTEVWRLFSKFFTANILFWELYVLDLKTNIFCRKKIQLHFPMNKGLTVPK